MYLSIIQKGVIEGCQVIIQGRQAYRLLQFMQPIAYFAQGHGLVRQGRSRGVNKPRTVTTIMRRALPYLVPQQIVGYNLLQICIHGFFVRYLRLGLFVLVNARLGLAHGAGAMQPHVVQTRLRLL